MATTIIGKVSPTMGGAYSAGQTYAALTFVENNGSLYISLQTAYGIEPGVSANWEQYWMLCASRGADGATGKGLEILGQYATLQELQQAVPNPSAGDAYSIGASVPYSVYIWDANNSAWVDNGQIQGPQGEAGQIEIGTVETGAPGTAASVTNVGTAESAILNFVIPQGYTGATGSTWYSGAGINGTASTPTVFPGSGVASANPNDFYLNSGTTNVYRCITGGAPSVATWVYVMALNAGAVLYNLAQTLSTEQQRQALENIGAAAAAHASTHARNGSDAITPGSIGAASLDANGVVPGTQNYSYTLWYSTQNRTLQESDVGRTLMPYDNSDHSKNYTITVPAHKDVAIINNAEIAILRYFPGDVTITPAKGVELRYIGMVNGSHSVRIANRYGMVALKKISSIVWLVTGDFEEVV